MKPSKRQATLIANGRTRQLQLKPCAILSTLAALASECHQSVKVPFDKRVPFARALRPLTAGMLTMGTPRRALLRRNRVQCTVRTPFDDLSAVTCDVLPSLAGPKRHPSRQKKEIGSGVSGDQPECESRRRASRRPVYDWSPSRLSADRVPERIPPVGTNMPAREMLAMPATVCRGVPGFVCLFVCLVCGLRKP